MKIAVYCIAKNEEAFVKRCMRSAKDADYFVLADTGSTDLTVDVGRQLGARVHQISVMPWRFDHARNTVLSLVPADADVCVSLDLDEVLVDGWRAEIERLWEEDTTRLQYKYDWGQGRVFTHDKIHARHGYGWKLPCHEFLVPDPRVTEKVVVTDKLFIQHLPDPEKSRSQYLGLLRVAVLENPSDPRTALYYARELGFHGRFVEAVWELQRYLSMRGTDQTERSFAQRLLGNAYKKLKIPNETEKFLNEAVRENPSLRDNWVELATFYYEESRWAECLEAAQHSLTLSERPDSVLTPGRPIPLHGRISLMTWRPSHRIGWDGMRMPSGTDRSLLI